MRNQRMDKKRANAFDAAIKREFQHRSVERKRRIFAEAGVPLHPDRKESRKSRTRKTRANVSPTPTLQDHPIIADAKKSARLWEHLRGGEKSGGAKRFNRKTVQRRASRYRWYFVTMLTLVVVSVVVFEAYQFRESRVWGSELFLLEEIAVEGNERITTPEILNSLGLTVGQSTMQEVVPKTLSERLQTTYRDLYQAEIVREMPGKVRVTVTERHPIARVETGGKTLIVDAEGVVLERPFGFAVVGEPPAVGSGRAADDSAAMGIAAQSAESETDEADTGTQDAADSEESAVTESETDSESDEEPTMTPVDPKVALKRQEAEERRERFAREMEALPLIVSEATPNANGSLIEHGEIVAALKVVVLNRTMGLARMQPNRVPPPLPSKVEIGPDGLPKPIRKSSKEVTVPPLHPQELAGTPLRIGRVDASDPKKIVVEFESFKQRGATAWFSEDYLAGGLSNFYRTYVYRSLTEPVVVEATKRPPDMLANRPLERHMESSQFGVASQESSSANLSDRTLPVLGIVKDRYDARYEGTIYVTTSGGQNG